MIESMIDFLDDIEKSLCNLKSINKTNTEIAAYKKRLKKTLTKKQKRLLLRWEDEKDLLIDKVTRKASQPDLSWV